jgi:hypothetical protein
MAFNQLEALPPRPRIRLQPASVDPSLVPFRPKYETILSMCDAAKTVKQQLQDQPALAN